MKIKDTVHFNWYKHLFLVALLAVCIGTSIHVTDADFAEVFGKNLNLFLTECYNVCYNDKAAKNGSIAQLVRAHALQAWGHRFESCCSHHIPSFKASHLPR